MQLIVLFLTVVCLTQATPFTKRQAVGGRQYWWEQEAPLLFGSRTAVEAPGEDGGGSSVAKTSETALSTRSGNLGASGFNSHSGTNSGSGFQDQGNTVDATSRTGECQGRGSVCVPYYQCDSGSVITDGAGLIDIRNGEEVMSTHSQCGRYLDVCCSKPYDGPITPPPLEPHTLGCGRRNTLGVHANIQNFNVTQTQFGEYPWMVAILRVENIGGEEVNLYLCGGSLIQPNVILTAAHCVNSYGVETLKVRAGEWDTQSDYELFPHQDRGVSHVITHPDFNPGSLWNDFAILILDTPLALAPNVDTVCLPNVDEDFDYVTCYATGWGKDKFGKSGRFQNILKQVELTVVPHPDCENALQLTRLGKFFKLDHSFLCAGGQNGIDTCKGDGGSPLVCARSTTDSQEPVYIQAGIVAWGIGCGEDGVPGVYADVTKAVDWIYESFQPYLVA